MYAPTGGGEVTVTETLTEGSDVFNRSRMDCASVHDETELERKRRKTSSY